MKRNNPETGMPFIYGDTRRDGYVFWGYDTRQLKKDGYYAEAWRNPEAFAAARSRSNKAKHSNRQTKWGRMIALVQTARHSAKKRGHPAPTVDAQMLSDIWDKQQGLCAYTQWPMSFVTGAEDLVSLERIDNSIGYTPDNVVLVCWSVNNARGDMAQSKFFAMCKAIASNMLVTHCSDTVQPSTTT